MPPEKETQLFALVLSKKARCQLLAVVSVIVISGLMLLLQFKNKQAQQQSDISRLKQIAHAMHVYETLRDQFPEPITFNTTGEKCWSWSIALLPYLEQRDLYGKIDFKNVEPWDSPKSVNNVFKESAPRVFTSARASTNSNNRNIFMISAKSLREFSNPVFVEGTKTHLEDITDGTSNTVLAIMLTKHSVPWASPDDLTPEEAFKLIQQEDDPVLVVMCDGAVSSIPRDIEWSDFDALVKRDDGAIITLDLPRL